ncbi:MAG: formylglycine-generating enzyme family protein [Chloroflexi bacterium]|nr:formylglycine-generating enzyme family protein [Chloroflexota bacterium]
MSTHCTGKHLGIIAAALSVLSLLVGCEAGTPVPSVAPPSPTPAPPTATPAPTATTTPTPVPVEPIVPDMVLVEPGTFQMGAADGRSDEQPVHTVQITRPFYIAKYEVTFAEYDRFCEDTGARRPNDRGWGRGQQPLINVDWYDAVAYCNWLSEKEGLTSCYSGRGKVTRCDFSANGYRLPTEAEWEYAARGGHLSQGTAYAGSDDAGVVAWYDANSGGVTHPVGQKQPNELGLYDMSGNMYEWCWDWYSGTYYTSSPVDDPMGPPPETSRTTRGPNKVRRSGSWREAEEFLHVAFRSIDYAGYPGDNGFRLARTP